MVTFKNHLCSGADAIFIIILVVIIIEITIVGKNVFIIDEKSTMAADVDCTKIYFIILLFDLFFKFFSFLCQIMVNERVLISIALQIWIQQLEDIQKMEDMIILHIMMDLIEILFWF